MRKFMIRFGLLLLFTAMTLFSSLAQDTQPRKKIGLALSGGGAKGLAHVGVLKVLEEIGVPIDYIAGTSMGSIVGALYAIGYGVDELEKLALTTDWAGMFNDDISRRYIAMEEKIWDGRYITSFPIKKRSVKLPSGIVAGQKIANFLSRLTWSVHHISDFKQLPIPFVCVATDIITGEAVAIDSGFLPDAIRASMAIPTLLTPISMQDYLFVDGGLVRNLPAEDVKRLGADIIIGVDVSFTLLPPEDINSFLDIITQSLSFVEAQSRNKQYSLCDVLIQPDMEGMGMFSFRQAENLIQRGEAAARQMAPRIKALLDSLDIDAQDRYIFIPPQVDSIYINNLKISGLQDVSKRMVLAGLNFNTPGWISATSLEQSIDRLYSSQFFERVTYELIPSDKGSSLIIHVIEKTINMFRFGLRYDSYFKAALLLNTTFRNFAEHGSNLVIDLRLGEESQIDFQYFVHTGLKRRVGLHARANYTTRTIDFYKNKQRESSMRVRSVTGESMFGSMFSTNVITGFGIKGEYSDIQPRIGPIDLAGQLNRFLAIYGLIWTDTFDRTLFPRNGHSMYLRSTFADDRVASNVSFVHHHLNWKGVIPLSPKTSALSRLQIGASAGSKIPLTYLFFLGGADSFEGLKYQERSGKHVQTFQLGIQHEIMSNRFILIRGNIGNTSNRWQNLFIRSRYVTGIGVTGGAVTPIGPIELTVMGGSEHRLMLYFNLGYKF